MSAVSGNPTMTSPSVERLENGATVTVGKHKVQIVDYMTEGGFAQIYKVQFIELVNPRQFPPQKSEQDGDDSEIDSERTQPDLLNNYRSHDAENCLLQPGELACLKRVMVQDENGLNELRNEVTVMQKLINAQNIVQLFDSNAQRYRKYSPNGFEVLLLMELCPNKSLLDYMNQRLATKLSESEILKIMLDTTMAVSQMHYLDIPLIHRDIKIENVLVDKNNNFKLCDFGSTSTTFPIVTTHREIAMLSQNIYVHTTPQYRSPEMIDLYRCIPIDEKSDIWALGVFLYKLLFFTTPFERTGQFAILHSKFEIPTNNYSSKLINLIIIMLSENPNLRPNIYQVVYQLCDMIHCTIPLNDKYGIGPYNFNQYSWFQNNLQTIQLQLFNLQNKRKQQNGNLSEEDNCLLDQLYMTAFNVSPMIPTGITTTSVSTTNPNPTTIPQPSAADRKTPNLQEHNYYGPEELEKQPHVHNANKQKDLQDMVMEESYYPTVGEINDYIDKEHVELQQQQQQQSKVPTEATNPSISTLKQHKSNNPFPKMNYGQGDGMNIYGVPPVQSQPQQPQSYNGANTNIQATYPSGRNGQNIQYMKQTNQYPQQNLQYQIVPPPQQPQQQQNQNSADLPIISPAPALPIQQNYPVMGNTVQNGIESSHIPAKPQQPAPLQDVTRQFVASPSSSSPTSSQSPVTSPPPVPPHPSKRYTGQRPARETEKAKNSESSIDVSPPEIPPHPVRAKLEHSLIDLSSPEKKPRSSMRDKTTEKDHFTLDNQEKSISGVQRSRSSGGAHDKKLISPPTTESIEFDLEGAKRKSLDFKLKQLSMESEQLQKGIDDEKDDESISEVKKSFEQQRLSLDLEKINNDALRDQKKKHKLFSRLRK